MNDASQPDSGVVRKAPHGSKALLVPTLIVVIALALIPLVWRNDYVVSLLALTMLFALMAQSWNLTVGMVGIWNFGQLAIVAIGGYATGVLTTALGLSAWLALPAGVIAGGLAAAIIVLPAARLRGIFAAILTFALAQAVRLLINADGSGLTGGRSGLAGVSGLFDGLSYSWNLRAYFWLTLVLSAAVMLLVDRMMLGHSGMGLASPTGPAQSFTEESGDRRRRVAVTVLVSGFIAGLAGGLYATFYHGITPTFMGLSPLGLLVIMVIVGGLGSVRGPVLGAFAITILHQLLRSSAVWWLVAQGVLLVLVLMFWPAGIDGLLQRGWEKLRSPKDGEKT